MSQSRKWPPGVIAFGTGQCQKFNWVCFPPSQAHPDHITGASKKKCDLSPCYHLITPSLPPYGWWQPEIQKTHQLREVGSLCPIIYRVLGYIYIPKMVGCLGFPNHQKNNLLWNHPFFLRPKLQSSECVLPRISLNLPEVTRPRLVAFGKSKRGKDWKMVMKLPSTRLPWFWREVSWQYHGWKCSKISFNEIKRKGMSMYGIHLHLTMLECLMLAPSYPKIGRACGIPQGVLSIVCIDRIRHGHKLHLHTKRLCQWNTCPCKRNHPSVVGWVAAAIRGLVVERRFYAIVGEIRKVGAGTYKISYLDLYLVIVWSI